MTTKRTPAPRRLQVKMEDTAAHNETSFAVRFDKDSDEIGWIIPADIYDKEPRYLTPSTAYYVKYDVNGTPYAIEGVNGYDCTEEALLLSISKTNAVQPAQSQEDPRDKAKPDIWTITRSFCR